MPSNIANQLNGIRRSRGVSAADLARCIGVSRQTIYAIEAGTFVPNTEVTLRLARALEVSVEELFSLTEERPGAPEPLHSEVLSAAPPEEGQPVRVCRIGHRLVSVPVSATPYFLPEADGVMTGRGHSVVAGDVVLFSAEEDFSKRLVVAGCDPAIGLLASMVERMSGVEIVSAAASSRLALKWLKSGSVHIAGTHLRDSRTGEFNVPIVRREFGDEEFTIITFARWEEGFVTARHNPKRIRGVADVARRGVKFMNREAGSGSRMLLETLLSKEGMDRTEITACERVAYGHLAAAYAVSAGEADCCIATRSAARVFGLDFVSLQDERYDLALRRSALDLPAVQKLLDVLQKASLRRKLEILGGYDTSQTGVVVV